jgi:uridine kinase
MIEDVLSYFQITVLNTQFPVIIGIDGPDCAGKTTLSISLLQRLMWNSKAIVIHCDDYRNDQTYRERRGPYCPEGFLYDYFNQEGIRQSVLEPFHGQKNANVLPYYVILEGLFLFRNPIDQYLDIRIRMEISEEQVMSRALKRDTGVIGDEELVRRRYSELAIPAQRLYRGIVDPAYHADILIQVLDDGLFSIRKNPRV